jgi:alkyl hydroperoxide reductase subunit AhpC
MMHSAILATLLSGLLVAQPPGGGNYKTSAAKASPELEAKAKKLIDADPRSEAAMMAKAILDGSQLGPGEGWFKTPPQKKYDWKWLAKLHDVAEDKSIDPKKFKGSVELFDVLDRDGDEELKAADFDWSPNSPFARQMQMAAAVFRPADRNGNGWLASDEWAGMFQRGGGKPLSQEGLRRLIFPKPPKKSKESAKDDGPTPDVLIKGLFAGEIGSMKEGPKLGDMAPDFTLKTSDGKQTIHLKDHFGDKPIVLVFGNFSCGPFRSWAATLSELAETHKSRATFLGVYVREAHPTDGWRMESNDRADIAFPQPTDQPARNAVANRCQAALKMPFPLLVDTMDDQAGHAYSAMPARLYVIDASGKVTYKSARGPFGFRPQEMEQALALTLLASSKPKHDVANKPSE